MGELITGPITGQRAELRFIGVVRALTTFLEHTVRFPGKAVLACSRMFSLHFRFSRLARRLPVRILALWCISCLHLDKKVLRHAKLIKVET